MHISNSQIDRYKHVCSGQIVGQSTQMFGRGSAIQAHHLAIKLTVKILLNIIG